MHGTGFSFKGKVNVVLIHQVAVAKNILNYLWLTFSQHLEFLNLCSFELLHLLKPHCFLLRYSSL